MLSYFLPLKLASKLQILLFHCALSLYLEILSLLLAVIWLSLIVQTTTVEKFKGIFFWLFCYLFVLLNCPSWPVLHLFVYVLILLSFILLQIFCLHFSIRLAHDCRTFILIDFSTSLIYWEWLTIYSSLVVWVTVSIAIFKSINDL